MLDRRRAGGNDYVCLAKSYQGNGSPALPSRLARAKAPAGVEKQNGREDRLAGRRVDEMTMMVHGVVCDVHTTRQMRSGDLTDSHDSMASSGRALLIALKPRHEPCSSGA